MIRRRVGARKSSLGQSQKGDTTVNLGDSDAESVTAIEVPSSLRRLNSNDSVVCLGNEPRGRRPAKRKKLVSVSSDSNSVIVEPQQPMASNTRNACPEIETEYYSLNTGIPKVKRPRLSKSVDSGKTNRPSRSSSNSKKSPASKSPAPKRKRPRKKSAGSTPTTKKESASDVVPIDEELDGNASRLKKLCPTPTAKKSVPPKKAVNKTLTSKPKQSPAPASVNLPGPSVSDDDCVVVWDSAEVLCVYQNIAPHVAKNLVDLFENDNTIPFIARYRRGMTGNMEAEQLRVVRDAYEELKTVKAKAKAAITKVKKLGELTAPVRKSILAATSVAELEDTLSQFKALAKGSLAERARSVGLEEPAMQLLHSETPVDPYKFICKGQQNLETIEEVELGMQHIVAEAVSKHADVLNFVKDQNTQHMLSIASKRMILKSKMSSPDKRKLDQNALKFKEFFKWTCSVGMIKPHTVLALNRGENLKVLSIKIVPDNRLQHSFMALCTRIFHLHNRSNFTRQKICNEAFTDAWNRLVLKAIGRHCRSELTRVAEREALDVFGSNLKQILLMPPLKGAVVLSIDPGFSHGCKIAVVSASGDVLHTDVIYPPFSGNAYGPASQKLKEFVFKFKVKVFALGDGTASAETSAWLGKLLEDKFFSPAELSYTIVSENGASIYSCSPEAKEEFPSLDPNVVSAVSIARRLQEPLAELVKIDPKHLGVGMYQHDLSDAKLKTVLDDVVQECVSFVGVDLNTASKYLLRQVAGLGDSKAQKIIQWRMDNGPFLSRQQLMEIKGIGAKSFEQCAGFVRIIGSSRAGGLGNVKVAPPKSKVKQEKVFMPNLLDSTNVHPEAYDSALELMRLSGVVLEDLGKPEFMAKVNDFVRLQGIANLVQKLQLVDEQAVIQLTEALTQGPAYDIRVKNRGPIFRKGFTKIEDLVCGEVFTGSVTNVTSFGAFVDIGVGTNGLIHVSRMNGKSLQVNQRVEVKVMKVELARMRIGLKLIESKS